MTPEALQELCETGSERLVRMDYLGAEAALAEAERHAWAARDWDTLARLYMPLQEARRQRRQRCGEGVVALDLLAQGPEDHIDGRQIVENFPHGQLLVAGWGSIEPAVQLRKCQAEHGLFLETFLGAVYPVNGGGRRVVVIVPTENARLPEPRPDQSVDARLPEPRPDQSVDDLIARLPTYSLVNDVHALPRGQRRGTTETYAEVMAIWERLHAPFLTAADAQEDLVRKMEGYRNAIRVDYASELAHQKLSDVARHLGRAARAAARG